MGQDVAHRVTRRGYRGRRGLAALAVLLGLSAVVAQTAAASGSDQAVAYGLDPSNGASNVVSGETGAESRAGD